MARPVVDLPEPDSPPGPALRSGDGEVRAVHGLEVGLHEMARVRDGQVLGLDGDRLFAPIGLALDRFALAVAHDQLLTDARHGTQQSLGVVVLRW